MLQQQAALLTFTTLAKWSKMRNYFPIEKTVKGSVLGRRLHTDPVNGQTYEVIAVMWFGPTGLIPVGLSALIE